jgi:RNA polymerase sigma-70 factor (ECF subfamily)
MWPVASETEALLRRVAQADALAADELWERHRPALRRLVDLRMGQALSRRVDASDIVQDVLLRANQRLADYLRNPSMPFHLWLRQIATDQVIDAHRRHRQAGKRSMDRERPLAPARPAGFADDRSSLDLAAQLRDPSPTPAAEALRHELEYRFRDALSRLDVDDREIILLRHFEQLSNGEAARTLGLSDAAAGMRHLRALRRLRAMLAEVPSAVSGGEAGPP